MAANKADGNLCLQQKTPSPEDLPTWFPSSTSRLGQGSRKRWAQKRERMKQRLLSSNEQPGVSEGVSGNTSESSGCMDGQTNLLISQAQASQVKPIIAWSSQAKPGQAQPSLALPQAQLRPAQQSEAKPSQAKPSQAKPSAAQPRPHLSYVPSAYPSGTNRRLEEEERGHVLDRYLSYVPCQSLQITGYCNDPNCRYAHRSQEDLRSLAWSSQKSWLENHYTHHAFCGFPHNEEQYPERSVHKLEIAHHTAELEQTLPDPTLPIRTPGEQSSKLRTPGAPMLCFDSGDEKDLQHFYEMDVSEFLKNCDEH